MGGADDEVQIVAFNEGQEVWILDTKNQENMWLLAKVTNQDGVFVTVNSRQGDKLLDLRRDSVFKKNPADQPDMTGLYYINEPGILMNLENRSIKDEAYTFMASVLVAVNPLKPLKNPDPKTLNPLVPHPFSVAENAFKQMNFAYDNHTFSGESVNQSVVTSGESGAGKTESCKMVLKHLVESTGTGESTQIDRKLLQSNPITESFGNAQTTRNHNSSRFGKFMKLHFKRTTEKGIYGKAAWSIEGASVATYLLERSRVTLHQTGERNFHVFYHLLSGLDSSQKKAYGFDVAESSCGFRYLSAINDPEDEGKKDLYKKEILKTDAQEYKELVSAMAALNINEADMYSVFRLVAGVMHLGNIVFENKVEAGNDVAIPKSHGSYDPAKVAAELLGLEHGDALVELMVQKEINVPGQTIIKPLDSMEASYSRDAIAKGIYSSIFDHIIFLIDTSLGGVGESSSLPYIGILDIFGFETFEINSFEQLLINFANEALQATFNRSVFENEAALYKSEGLRLDASEMHKPPDNSACMDLFSGVHVERKNSKINNASVQDRGLLLAIDDESQITVDPSDRKMLQNLHRNFSKHKDWMKVHPRQKGEIFIIRHFAGAVKYTIGSFIEKNKDKLPKAVESVFSGSKSEILSRSFKAMHGKKTSPTIVKKFRQQMHDLVETLESTKCSFIRCVKPNKEMQRGSNNSWFNRQYVSMQLRNLSIPQTAEVLQVGFPTRLTYKSLLDTYMSILPSDAVKRWETHGGEEKLFVKALFFAFELDSKTYKLGLTMVFFRSGDLAQLNEVLRASSHWEKDPKKKAKIVKRFKHFYIRLKWKNAYAKVFAYNQFKYILLEIRERKRREEEERKKREEEARKKQEAELAALERAQEEKARIEQERIEEQKRIEQQLEEDRLRREKMESEEEERKAREAMTVEEVEVAEMNDEIDEMAHAELRERHKDRGDSLTSGMYREDLLKIIKETQANYASITSSNKIAAKFQQMYWEMVEDGKTLIEKTVEKGMAFFKPLLEKITDKERWEKAYEKWDEEIRTLNMILLEDARKNPAFREVENNLQKRMEKFRTKYKNAKQKVKQGGNKQQLQPSNDGLARVSSVVVMDKEEFNNPEDQYHRTLQTIKEGVEKGIYTHDMLLQAVAKGDLESEASYQATPQNRYSDVFAFHEDDPQKVRPSDDKEGDWCAQPLPWDNGFLYFSKSTQYIRGEKAIVIKCCWEHKKKKISFTGWDTYSSISRCALVYDIILSSKKIKKQVKDKNIPMFPTWNVAEYEAGKKKLKGFFGFSKENANEKLKLMQQCVDERALQKDPEQITKWLEKIFEIFSKVASKGENNLLLEDDYINREFFELDNYAGLENWSNND